MKGFLRAAHFLSQALVPSLSPFPPQWQGTPGTLGVNGANSPHLYALMFNET